MRASPRPSRPLVLLLLACFGIPLAWSGERVRPSALAGTWYPGDAADLSAFVDATLDAPGKPPPKGEIRALIAPHAGYRYSGSTAGRLFSLVRGRAFERIILLAPAHRSPVRGLSIAEVDAYETPLGKIPLDTEAIARLRGSSLVTADPMAHAREHAIEIELPMLQRTLAPGWRLVPILVGRMEAEDYGIAADLLHPLVEEGSLLVVSSDFTHYGARFGYMPFPLDERTPANIRSLDDGAVEHIQALDPDGLLGYQARTGITICGYRPITLLLHLLPAESRVHPIAYATSGELTGDYANSVSYLALAVTAPLAVSAPRNDKPPGTPEEGAARDGTQRGSGTDRRFRPPRAVDAEGDGKLHSSGSESRKPTAGPVRYPPEVEEDLRLLHRLAMMGVAQGALGPSEGQEKAIEQVLEGLPAHLQEPAGAFVTLKRDGRLRGCIGYILPRKPLYRAVLENGVNAAVNDRRFRRVAPGELAELEVEVSVLSPPEPIASYEEFRVGEQGIILHKDGRQAVFLPEVASEQGWSREETLNQLARKAGLGPDAWREGASFEVFTSSKYSAPYASPTRPQTPRSLPYHEPSTAAPNSR